LYLFKAVQAETVRLHFDVSAKTPLEPKTSKKLLNARKRNPSLAQPARIGFVLRFPIFRVVGSSRFLERINQEGGVAELGISENKAR
jgi:hypothetical protein